MNLGTLYLLPVGLGECAIEDVLPKKNIDLIRTLTNFIAENAKESRAFLKQCGYNDISKAEFFITNKHTDKKEINEFLQPILLGKNIGLMSDAGCPGIADPGAEIVKLAHQKNIKVVPLVGPSAIVLSIMASGFNGQNFAFNGYLPIEKLARIKKIKELELICIKQQQAQFFIETPYRNQSLFDDLLKTLQPASQILVATDVTLTNECINVNTTLAWKKLTIPDFFKKPTVFGIYF